MPVNWDVIKGKWTQLKGSARSQWGQLTDDEWDQIAGDREQLIGKLQERYGVTSAFFASYGPEIGKRWQETKQLLDQPPFEADESKVIEGARRTFEFLQNWLSVR